jgi:phosphinothricin acetyltransferase
VVIFSEKSILSGQRRLQFIEKRLPMTSEVNITLMSATDWPAIAAIYQQGIDGGNATFATEVQASWEEWSHSKLPVCRLVARLADEVVGWAVLSPVSSRPVYRGVTEVSIYVASQAHGRGVGSTLMEALIESSEANGIWTLQSLVFPENEASMKLHEKWNFKLLAIHEKMGLMEIGPFAGRWRDVALLERRSRVVGV